MGDPEVNNDRFYIRDKIYVPNSKKLQLYLLQKHHDLPKQEYSGHKVIFQSM